MINTEVMQSPLPPGNVSPLLLVSLFLKVLPCLLRMSRLLMFPCNGALYQSMFTGNEKVGAMVRKINDGYRCRGRRELQNTGCVDLRSVAMV